MWQTGLGWLVVAGGEAQKSTVSDLLDTVTLRWAYPGRPIAVLPTAGGSLTELEELALSYGDLCGAGGYVVPVFDPADAHQADNCQLLAESGLIYLADGPDAVGLARVLRGSLALRAVEQAFLEGASLLGVGGGAMALGSWMAAREARGPTDPGLDWLQNVVVEPRFAGAASATRLRGLLSAHPECLGLGIPEGAALALGPDGQVEPVGEQQVTVVVSQTQAGG
jgi:cyanophycinase